MSEPSTPARDLWTCDEDGCVGNVNGKTVAISDNRNSLWEDCRRAQIVVVLAPISAAEWGSCDAMIIDRRSVWKRGAHAIYLIDDKIDVENASDYLGNRPWSTYE